MIGRLSRTKLPVAGALLAAALLLLVGVGLARYEDRLYTAQQTSALDEQARILAASVTAAVSFDDKRAVQEYINALKVNPDIRAAGVYDNKGALVAQFLRGAALPVAVPAPGIRLKDDLMQATEPVVERGRAIGTVSLLATAEPIQRRIARYVGLILLVTMGALVIAVLSLSQVALSKRAEELASVNERLREEMAERQKTEEALRQSHKMEAIGQLSGGIAHDFNNLIMIAKSSLTLVRKGLGSGSVEPDKTARYLAAADEALGRAAALTRRILAFSRQQPLSLVPVRLGKLVNEMMSLIRHSVGDRVEIDLDLTENWLALCDVSQMENVILNLAINARDAMPDGGTLLIRCRDIRLEKAPPGVAEFLAGEYVELTVQDSGEGMSKEISARAVDPFFTTKPLGKGTGLGLSMTFGYVRQSNGYLVIDSVPKKGTSIVIYLPRYLGETA
jgi:signal transduction histidine kinase